jgi:hypothetical protein
MVSFRFIPRERVSRTHLTGGYVDARAGVDVEIKNPCPRRVSIPICSGSSLVSKLNMSTEYTAPDHIHSVLVFHSTKYFPQNFVLEHPRPTFFPERKSERKREGRR